MNELRAALKVLIANQTFMYYKTHAFHWNVEGIMFSQYHDFFGDLYVELYGAIDTIAEQIRALDEYAPTSISELYNYKTIPEAETRVVLIRDMLQLLITDNDEVISSLNKIFKLATEQNKQGLCNFIADRLDIHSKHGWMLKSSHKSVGEN